MPLIRFVFNPGFLLAIHFFSFSYLTHAQNINTAENFPDPNFRAGIEKYMGDGSERGIYG
ncbi:MAG: hypothetical protein C4527_25020 [Candidatus Omnitrophota bacterium]|jgi:hypothetical protein|nr:MAG: hypothetical protein C4527_25020 [Candidatus Omnitrophota bacterium]